MDAPLEEVTHKRPAPEKQESQVDSDLAKKPRNEEIAATVQDKTTGFTFGGWKSKPKPAQPQSISRVAFEYPTPQTKKMSKPKPAPPAVQLSNAEEIHRQSLLLQAEGCTLAEEGNFAGALVRWDQAIRLTPDRAVLHELRAQVLIEMDQVFPAVQAATMAVTLAPHWPEGYLTLARAQLNYGEVELAIENLTHLLRIDSQNSIAKAELLSAQDLLPRKKEYDLARQKEIEKVIEEGRRREEKAKEEFLQKMEEQSKMKEEDRERGMTGMSNKEWRGFVAALKKSEVTNPTSVFNRLLSWERKKKQEEEDTFVEEMDSEEENEKENEKEQEKEKQKEKERENEKGQEKEE
jgi:predicted Zn-dependent protease